MLDPHLLRNQLDQVAEKLRQRGFDLDVEEYRNLEARRKDAQMLIESARSKRNAQAKTIGAAKARGEDITALLADAGRTDDIQKASEESLTTAQAELERFSLLVPNIPHSSVPTGTSEEDNVEVRRWGMTPQMNFDPKDHVDLGAALGGMDFEAGTRIASSRFVVLSGALARMQRALAQFMLDTHTKEHGYTEVYVPFLVNARSMQGTGQLPKFAQDLFSVSEQGFYLIPTAEVPVTNLAQDQIYPADALPKRYVCHSPCFRSEAGSYGKDTRGMIRQHQFEKVELVQLVDPDKSYAALEELTGHAEKILQKLNLHYRVVALCSADLGFSSAKTYDLEVWLPSQNRFREISSCSNFEAFQARRVKARWRNPGTGKPELLHTLNGSGLAVGRTLLAIMENCQDERGRIKVPDALVPYMDGVELLV